MRLRSACPFALCLFALVLFAACNGQSEGQECTKLNGNADCSGGLVCTFRPAVTSDRCCPANLNLSTTAVCGVQQGGIDAATGAPDVGDAGDAADVSTSDVDMTDTAVSSVPAADANTSDVTVADAPGTDTTADGSSDATATTDGNSNGDVSSDSLAE